MPGVGGVRGPPSALGAGPRAEGASAYPHRTTQWSGRATVGIHGRRGVVRCGPPLTASVRWPARREAGGGLYPRAAMWVGGGRGAGPVPGGGGLRGAAGRPGSGALYPGRDVLPPTEQRTGADRAKGGLSPAAVRTWRGGSPRALGRSRVSQSMSWQSGPSSSRQRRTMGMGGAHYPEKGRVPMNQKS